MGVTLVHPTDVLELALVDLIQSRVADPEPIVASIEAAMTELEADMSPEAAAQFAVILDSLSAARSVPYRD